MVSELKAAGLVGMEAYYNGYTADEIKYLAGLAEKAPGSLAGLGCGVPGAVDPREGRVLTAPNLPWLVGKPISFAQDGR